MTELDNLSKSETPNLATLHRCRKRCHSLNFIELYDPVQAKRWRVAKFGVSLLLRLSSSVIWNHSDIFTTIFRFRLIRPLTFAIEIITPGDNMTTPVRSCFGSRQIWIMQLKYYKCAKCHVCRQICTLLPLRDQTTLTHTNTTQVIGQIVIWDAEIIFSFTVDAVADIRVIRVKEIRYSSLS